MDRVLSLRKEASGQTITVQAEPASLGPSTPRACMALVPGSGSHLSTELHCLLRRRLRIAALIALCGLTLFLIRNLLLLGSQEAPASVDLAIQSAVVAVVMMLNGLLWSSYQVGTPCLRRAELVLFGVNALHFAYLQYVVFSHGRLLSWAGAAEGSQDRVLSLGAQANALRWFMLIVMYGTFIPNTWKRCTAVVATLVAVPVVLNFVLCAHCPVMGSHTWTATFDLLVILGVGAAIAIFGSYKISMLQAEAFAARKLGQYQLREKLGSGGMGEVYLGEHTLLRRACAIKIIRADKAGDPTNLARFEREVRAMATLTHWNTVEVYDYGRADDGTFFYVMEYLPGMSLQELVENHGPLPPARALHFLRQICAALKEAHGIGLMHRDIKPSNVLVCERGGVPDVVKLLDFGLVQHVGMTEMDGRVTVQGSILGSPTYMSPEQALGKPGVDARTDIYSLGGLAYFLLTGQGPFVRETAMEHLVAHLHDAVPPPRQVRQEVPEDMEDVILRCLQKKADDRYPDVVSVDQAFAACESSGLWDAEQAQRWWQERDQASARQSELVA